MEGVLADRLSKVKLYKIAFGLAIFTIVYNLGEGILSTLFGFEDESLTLFGFGVDSFIEVMSGLGIARMVSRIQSRPEGNRDPFERTALKITGVSFYILVVALVVMSIYNAWTGHKPIATLWGVIISIVSIFIMWDIGFNQNKSWQTIEFSSHSCRCLLYQGLHLYVGNSAYV